MNILYKTIKKTNEELLDQIGVIAWMKSQENI